MKKINQKSEGGFSLFELIVVLAVASILSALAIMSFASQRLFKADQQAAEIVDIFQEARQRALSHRRTMRVEINATNNTISLINEEDVGNPLDDVVIRSKRFIGNGVFIGTKPSNQTTDPTESAPVPEIAFRSSTHPLSNNDSVATLRFLRNGTVADAGNDGSGTGSVPLGATIFIWSKHINDTSTNPTVGQVFRAVTVLASSGIIRAWKCPLEANQCTSWRN